MNVTVESVWDGFAGSLKRFIVSRVGDEPTAEDILQEVFLKIHAQLERLKDTAKLESWVYRITRNAIIDHHRRSRVSVELPKDLVAEDRDELAGEIDLKPSVKRMVESLPEPYRQALILTEYEGLSQVELARRLGISFSGAKSRVQRAREKVRQMLLECCHLEFDRRGKIIACVARCCCCGPPPVQALSTKP
jgi:RNA polymerase sigma-70 factor, ECF subfamily